MIADQAIFKCKPNCVIIHLYSLKFPFIHLTIRLGELVIVTVTISRPMNLVVTHQPTPGILVLIQLLPTVYDKT